MTVTNQTIREAVTMQLSKDSGKRLVFPTGVDDIWNVVDVRTSAALPVKTFKAACYIAANFGSICVDLSLEKYAGELLGRTIKNGTH